VSVPDAFQAFDDVGAFIVVLDGDGGIVHWNRACVLSAGMTAEDVRGRRFWDVVAPGTDAPNDLGPAPPGAFATSWITSTGGSRWIAWSTAARGSTTTSPAGFIITGTDQTACKAAEDALKTSEARLGGVVGIAVDAIISIDSAQNILLYNGGAERIFGWSATEIIGAPLDRLLPERIRPDCAQHVSGHAEGIPEMPPMEGTRVVVGVRKSGEEFPAQAAISRLDVAGPPQFVVVLRDLTDQTERDRNLEFLATVGAELAATPDYDATLASVARLATLALADCCIIDLIDNGEVRRATVVHRDTAAASVCAALRDAPLDRSRPHLGSSVLASRQVWIQADVSSTFLASIAQSDEHLGLLQRLQPSSLMAVPLVAHGELLGSLVFVSSHEHRRYGPADVRLAETFAHTAALAIERAQLFEVARVAIHDSREANEQMVQSTIRAHERTDRARLATRQAEDSERELQVVGGFRELFIGIVGHDLRNPLASIRLSADLLRGRLDGDGEAVLDRIVSSSQRMTRMIAQLLDLTRARLGGGFPLETRRVDLRDVCRAVLREFRVNGPDAADGHSAGGDAAGPVQLNVQGDLAGIWDADRLTEALSNIVGNAIEHRRAATPVMVDVVDHGDAVVVEVANQGDPIPADILHSIFEPFRRANQHQRSAAGNLGLGLYIAHQIVLSHGGTMGVRSDNGRTTFWMRLPRGGEVLVVQPGPAKPAPGPVLPRRIVLVDDSEDLRATFRKILERRGHHVVEASDGLGGVALILAERPDIAIVDIGLPGIDGYEVARRVRAVLGPAIHLAAMTGYGSPADRERARQAGFDTQVTKPVDIDAIERLLADGGRYAAPMCLA
jgi:PAS domain S-box-containing protein